MTAHRAKVYELVLFNKIFVQLFWSSFSTFFLVLPSTILSDTFDIPACPGFLVHHLLAATLVFFCFFMLFRNSGAYTVSSGCDSALFPSLLLIILCLLFDCKKPLLAITSYWCRESWVFLSISQSTNLWPSWLLWSLVRYQLSVAFSVCKELVTDSRREKSSHRRILT